MRTSFIVARLLIVDAHSMAGCADKDLPGIGTFAYTGSPVGTQAIVLAAN